SRCTSDTKRERVGIELGARGTAGSETAVISAVAGPPRPAVSAAAASYPATYHLSVPEAFLAEASQVAGSSMPVRPAGQAAPVGSRPEAARRGAIPAEACPVARILMASASAGCLPAEGLTAARPAAGSARVSWFVPRPRARHSE